MRFRHNIQIVLLVMAMCAVPRLIYAGIECAGCGAMNPSSPSDHRPGCAYGAQSNTSGHSSGGRGSCGPSMKSMVAATVMGSLLDAAFSSPPPAPAPTGPTPEQLAAQAQLEEQQRQLQEQREAQQRQLQERQRQEFLRSRSDLAATLKGSKTTYVEDRDIRTTGGIKLKSIPPAASVSDGAHDSFFGTLGSVRPTVALLREEQATDLLKDEAPLIEQRIEAPNKWCSAAYATLKTKAPPLPYKKFSELQPGDVLLIEASGGSKLINKGDNLLSGTKSSTASHTVLFLKEVNGVKHFLENTPFGGPRIIFEEEFLAEYSSRGAQVARLAQPLNNKEASELYGAAVEMSAKNRKDIVGTRWLGTNYGAWGDENVVCSEADWALLKLAGRDIPKSGDRIKEGLGIDFSPADFFNNGQYFLVSPLDMPGNSLKKE